MIGGFLEPPLLLIESVNQMLFIRKRGESDGFSRLHHDNGIRALTVLPLSHPFLFLFFGLPSGSAHYNYARTVSSLCPFPVLVF